MQSLYPGRGYTALPVTQKQPPFLARQLQNLPLQAAQDISRENVLKQAPKLDLQLPTLNTPPNTAVQRTVGAGVVKKVVLVSQTVNNGGVFLNLRARKNAKFLRQKAAAT